MRDKKALKMTIFEWKKERWKQLENILCEILIDCEWHFFYIRTLTLALPIQFAENESSCVCTHATLIDLGVYS